MAHEIAFGIVETKDYVYLTGDFVKFKEALVDTCTDQGLISFLEGGFFALNEDPVARAKLPIIMIVMAHDHPITELGHQIVDIGGSTTQPRSVEDLYKSRFEDLKTRKTLNLDPSEILFTANTAYLPIGQCRIPLIQKQGAFADQNSNDRIIFEEIYRETLQKVFGFSS